MSAFNIGMRVSLRLNDGIETGTIDQGPFEFGRNRYWRVRLDKPTFLSDTWHEYEHALTLLEVNGVPDVNK